MSIAVEPFAPVNRFATYDPYPPLPRRIIAFAVQCHYCGFEPRDPFVHPSRCPKCHGHSWERFTRPRSLLAAVAAANN
jgi:hypothetical protein